MSFDKLRSYKPNTNKYSSYTKQDEETIKNVGQKPQQKKEFLSEEEKLEKQHSLLEGNNKYYTGKIQCLTDEINSLKEDIVTLYTIIKNFVPDIQQKTDINKIYYEEVKLDKRHVRNILNANRERKS